MYFCNFVRSKIVGIELKEKLRKKVEFEPKQWKKNEIKNLMEILQTHRADLPRSW